jgi:hypothetical protein
MLKHVMRTGVLTIQESCPCLPERRKLLSNQIAKGIKCKAGNTCVFHTDIVTVYGNTLDLKPWIVCTYVDALA